MGLVEDSRIMEDKTFELLTQMYSEMNKRFDEVDKKLDGKADKKDIARLENEIYPKIEVLFDGYKQHTDILERIEKEITKQEKIIMRHVK